MTADEWRRDLDEGRRLAEMDAAADAAFDAQYDTDDRDYTIANYFEGWKEP